VGCGFGDISVRIENYYGIDIRENVIEIAKSKYPKKFDCMDISEINKNFDWIISSGVFCFKKNWKKQTFITIEQMWGLSNKGVAINFLSDLSNGKKDEDMKFVKIHEIMPLIKKLTNKFIIRHDYLPNDFTIYLYK
jgi:2-polyprenyl-3-methyl-5-hydroxy-6-metoxy-1,4-benzoquinol methylase